MTAARRVILFLGFALLLIGIQCTGSREIPGGNGNDPITTPTPPPPIPPQPSPPPLADSDGDGIPDTNDECPTEAGSVANGGCPDEASGGEAEPAPPITPNTGVGVPGLPAPEIPVDAMTDKLIGFTSSDGKIGLNVVDHPATVAAAIRDRSYYTSTRSEREVLRQMIEHYQGNYTGTDPAFDTRLREMIEDLNRSVTTTSTDGDNTPVRTDPQPVTGENEQQTTEAEPVCLTGTYEKGVLSFNEIPPLLYLGKLYEVRIVIHHTQTDTATQTVLDRIDGENDARRDAPIVPGEIPTGDRIASPVSLQRFVRADLKTPATNGLRITERFERSVQEMMCGDSSQWQYTIEPLAEGTFPIFFNVLSGPTVDNLQPLNEDSATRQIEVRVEEAPVARGREPVIADQKDMLWLIVVGVLALTLIAALLWWYLRGRKNGAVAKREVLWFMAQPSNTSELQLASEIQRTRNHVRNFEEQNDIRFDINPATTTQVLLDSVINSPARIVHFSGHGTEGGLYVLNDAGRYHALPNDALGRTFDLMQGNVECVVLSSCYSEAQAQIIASRIKYTIGFDREVIDDHTLKFSPVFYENYARGEDIRTCFERAKLYLEMEDHAETAASLVLFEDGDRVVF